MTEEREHNDKEKALAGHFDLAVLGLWENPAATLPFLSGAGPMDLDPPGAISASAPSVSRRMGVESRARHHLAKVKIRISSRRFMWMSTRPSDTISSPSTLLSQMLSGSK